MTRSILVSGLSFFLCLVLAGTAAAQPQDTQWYETLVAEANQDSQQQVGENILLPEEYSLNAADGGAGASSNVEFGPPGPPSGTATVSGFAELGNADVTASANITVNFFAQVVQTSTPPVVVTIVPVTITASGTADATGSPGFPAQSFSDVTILLNEESVFLGNASANANGPTTASFDETATANVPLLGILNAALVAQASISALGVDAGGASASAFVDPVIEVADETIPGTSDSYRDHFAIEFGDGYYALGDPTPVEPATWGRIKSLYRN